MASPEQNAWTESLPDPVVDALPSLLHAKSVPDWLSTSQMRKHLALWLEPSWRQAQAMGISDVEFAHWVRVGLWNIAGDSRTARLIAEYRAVAGEDGWKLARAAITPDSAAEQADSAALADLIEAADVMTALASLADTVPAPAPDVPASSAVSTHDRPAPLDFS